jgi:ABC-type polysaccharide/polyol phosphate transport system ATPase subunit
MVTHDLTYVTEFCNRAVLLEQGRLVHDGAPEETVALYRERVTKKKLLAAGTSGRFEDLATP